MKSQAVTGPCVNWMRKVAQVRTKVWSRTLENVNIENMNINHFKVFRRTERILIHLFPYCKFSTFVNEMGQQYVYVYMYMCVCAYTHIKMCILDFWNLTSFHIWMSMDLSTRLKSSFHRVVGQLRELTQAKQPA